MPNNTMTKNELKRAIKQKKAEEKIQKKINKKLAKSLRVKKKLGYTEKLVKNVLMFCWVAIFLGIYYTFKFQANEVWSSILDVVKYLSVSTIGFFVWKARSENLIKISNNPDFEVQEYAREMQERIMEDFKDETIGLDKEKYL